MKACFLEQKHTKKTTITKLNITLISMNLIVIFQTMETVLHEELMFFGKTKRVLKT